MFLRIILPSLLVALISPLSARAENQSLCLNESLREAVGSVTKEEKFFKSADVGRRLYDTFEKIFKDPSDFESGCKESAYAIVRQAVEHGEDLHKFAVKTVRTLPDDYEFEIYGRRYYRDAKLSNYAVPNFSLPCGGIREAIQSQKNFETALARFVYVNQLGVTMNRMLRGGGEKAACVEALSRKVQEGFEGYPSFAGEIYRGLKRAPIEAMARYEPGKVVEETHFSSTSKSEKTVRDFFFDPTEGWLFLIKSLTCKDISSYNSTESEVLCFPGTRFLVEKRDDQSRTMWLSEIE